MADTAWKRAERTVARILGGRRVSADRLGRGGPDVEAGRLVCETKYRSRIPKWLLLTESWIQEQKRQGKIAVKCVRIRGRSDGLAVMSLELFAEIAKKLGWTEVFRNVEDFQERSGGKD